MADTEEQPTNSIQITSWGTSSARCMRIDLMDWKMSTTPSVFSRSSWAWKQMKVPVRPTPSLCVNDTSLTHRITESATE